MGGGETLPYHNKILITTNSNQVDMGVKMARIFDVVEYPSEMTDEIVHRFPETGIADLRIGSQVIVRESQWAVFFRMVMH